MGLVAVPPEVIAKAEQGRLLSPAERDVLAGAPEAAYRMIAHIPRLQNVAAIVRYQDHAFGGQPRDGGPSGDALPAGARLLHVLKALAVAGKQDSPDAFTVTQLRTQEGQYDPTVLEAATGLWASGAAAPAEGWVRKDVPLAGLLPGDRLVADIVFESGKLLLGAGIQVSLAQIERLRALRRLDRLREPILIARAVKDAAEDSAA